MVKGLDLFRERFRDFEGSFTLIGGAACDEWFTAQGLPFRATKDLDIVLIIEVIDRAFVGAIRNFINEGEYEIRQRTEESPILYRFAKPKNEAFPFMLELFSRKPEGLELADAQLVGGHAAQPVGAETDADLGDGATGQIHGIDEVAPRVAAHESQGPLTAGEHHRLAEVR